MKKITILIVEDDDNVCSNFKSIIDNYSELKLLHFTNSSSEAMTFVNMHNPDVIILDLELQDGEGSGLVLLNELQKKQLDAPPFIIVTTNNPSQSISEAVHQLGVDFTLKKYQPNYSETLVLDHLIILKDQILSKKRKLNKKLDTDNYVEINYKPQIFNELNTFGISLKGIAYKYITDAILFTIENPNADYLNMLSVKYKKSEDSIKKAMQYAITHGWDRADPDIISKCYTSTIDVYQGGPTIKAFVKYYAEKVKLSIDK